MWKMFGVDTEGPDHLPVTELVRKKALPVTGPRWGWLGFQGVQGLLWAPEGDAIGSVGHTSDPQGVSKGYYDVHL